VAERFLAAILAHPKVKPLLSREHFSVDGTLIEAWASVKSFQRRDQDTRDSHGTDGESGPPAGGGRNAERDFHGERRSNATHASTTDPDARLFRKGAGKEAKLAYMGHLLTENRNGLIVDVRTTRAHGNAETLAAADMLAARARRPGMTVGADKGYDTKDFVMELRELGITPHVAQNAYDTGKTRRRSAIDGRTTRHPGYAASQRARKRIEECFGWIKAGAGGRKARHRGLDRVGWQVTLTAAAYNLVRLPKLIGAGP
jgi:IS5 family transposase